MYNDYRKECVNMYDINLKNVKKGRNFFLIFFIVGVLSFVILTSVIIFTCINYSKLDSSVMSINATLIQDLSDGNVMYKRSYDYEVDGKLYTCVSSMSSTSSSIPDNKKIHYDSANPMNCEADSITTTVGIISIFYIIPVVFSIVGLVGIIKNCKRVKMINELCERGKLVKGLKYHLEPSNYTVNGVSIMKPVIDYQLPNGDIISLSGDPRHDRKSGDADGLVDLLIDEDNPDNYFIDFEINRLSGNSESDYYKEVVSDEIEEDNSNSDEGKESNDNIESYQTITYKDLQNK